MDLSVLESESAGSDSARTAALPLAGAPDPPSACASTTLTFSATVRGLAGPGLPVPELPPLPHAVKIPARRIPSAKKPGTFFISLPPFRKECLVGFSPQRQAIVYIGRKSGNFTGEECQPFDIKRALPRTGFFQPQEKNPVSALKIKDLHADKKGLREEERHILRNPGNPTVSVLPFGKTSVAWLAIAGFVCSTIPAIGARPRARRRKNEKVLCSSNCHRLDRDRRDGNGGGHGDGHRVGNGISNLSVLQSDGRAGIRGAPGTRPGYVGGRDPQLLVHDRGGPHHHG